MFTPAITASSTTAPCVIIVNAFCTAVTFPLCLNLFPFAEEITIGLAGLCTRMFGNWSTDDLVPASVSPATAPVRMKSRRLIVLVMDFLMEKVLFRLSQRIGRIRGIRHLSYSGNAVLKL